jgi:flagellar biosynthesis GTPase FlhF
MSVAPSSYGGRSVPSARNGCCTSEPSNSVPVYVPLLEHIFPCAYFSKMESEVEILRKQLQEEQRLREEEQRLREEAQRREQEARQREEEAQRREQEAERLREEAQRREQEAQRREQETERLREEDRHRYERRTGKTTLPEFLDACHTHLSLGLTIQPDSTQSTQGDASNAENKPRPDRILPWIEFDAEQAHTWETLMESEFVLERDFTSLHTLEESGEAVRRRQMGSELDLNTFARFTVEDPVS